MGDISNVNNKSMVVHNKIGPSSGVSYKKFQPQREQNNQGMLMWQSRLQEKLLKEQKDKKQVESEQLQQRFRTGPQMDHGEQTGESEMNEANKTTVHFPKISSSVSYNNLGTVSRGDVQGATSSGFGHETQTQYPILQSSYNSTVMKNTLLVTPAGPIPNQYFPGGCGAPRRSPSGKVLTKMQGHIDIRYHQKDTRGFDQSIRYQVDKDRILKYKQELDKQVEEKRVQLSRHPGRLNRLPTKITSMKSDESDDGVELAPLLRSKYYSKSLPKLDHHYLSSTDVTSSFNFSPRRVQFYYTPQPETSRSSGSGGSSASQPVGSTENAYASILRQQTNMKLKQLENEKTLETVANEHHFNTWDSFWGRPGHGAPINYYSEEQHKKGDLWKLLHSSNRKK